MEMSDSPPCGYMRSLLLLQLLLLLPVTTFYCCYFYFYYSYSYSYCYCYCCYCYYYHHDCEYEPILSTFLPCLRLAAAITPLSWAPGRQVRWAAWGCL